MGCGVDDDRIDTLSDIVAIWHWSRGEVLLALREEKWGHLRLHIASGQLLELEYEVRKVPFMNVAHLVASEEEISHVVESQSSEGEVLNPADLALDVIFDLN